MFRMGDSEPETVYYNTGAAQSMKLAINSYRKNLIIMRTIFSTITSQTTAVSHHYIIKDTKYTVRSTMIFLDKMLQKY